MGIQKVRESGATPSYEQVIAAHDAFVEHLKVLHSQISTFREQHPSALGDLHRRYEYAAKNLFADNVPL